LYISSHSHLQDFLTTSDILLFTNSLRSLSEMKSFHGLSFECVIEKIRYTVAKQLWDLVVYGGDLLGHLKAFKNYLLLNKGDFYHCFINESRSLMQLPPKANAEHGIVLLHPSDYLQTLMWLFSKPGPKVQLKRIPTLIGSTSNCQTQKVCYCQIPTHDLEERDQFLLHKGWMLAVDYQVDWPLDLIFTQDILDKYNSLFRFMFSFKCVQLELQRAWVILHMNCKRMSTLERARVMPLRLLQRNMSFLVDNLQFYFHVSFH
jgi:gamma-tubulin complex component 4